MCAITMGVNVDAFTPCLLQKLVQILQIMAGHHNKRPAPDIGADAGRNRIAKGLRVGAIQQRHAAEVDLTELHDQRQPFFHAVLLRQRRQSPVKPTAHLLILITQRHGVVGVGRHAFHSEKQRRPQGYNVGLTLKKLHRFVLLVAYCESFRLCALYLLLYRVVVKIYILKCGEKTVCKQSRYFV